MNTMWIAGPYHGSRSEGTSSRGGTHMVAGTRGTHRYTQFLVLGHVLFCRHESLTDGEAIRLVATVQR